MNEMIRTFQDAEKFIYSFTNYERQPDTRYNPVTYNLTAFRDFLGRLGSPHREGKSIHIAGTKGKGAVSAIISAIVSAHGLQSGLYTSPHLTSVRERIRIQGKAISTDDFTYWVSFIQRKILEENRELRRSYRTTFELLTALAFCHFRQTGVDYNILEVGMGGRLDCTNVVLPQIAVLTPISKDHVESLGNTVEKISYEKAGIIKSGVPVVSAKQPKPAIDVITKFAQRQNAGLVFINDRIKTKIKSMSKDGTIFNLRIGNIEYKNLFLRLPGDFQVENAALALLAVQTLSDLCLFDMQENRIREAMGMVRWPGRFSFLPAGKWIGLKDQEVILLDGAHNPAGARALAESILRMFPGKQFITILAAPSNKDIRNIAKYLAPVTREFILTRYSNSRSASLDQLEDAVTPVHPKISKFENLVDALPAARQSPFWSGQLLITGSLYLAGEIYESAGLAQSVLDIY